MIPLIQVFRPYDLIFIKNRTYTKMLLKFQINFSIVEKEHFLHFLTNSREKDKSKFKSLEDTYNFDGNLA